MRKKLGVLVDGAPLPEEKAYALWDRFSLWMEEHRGDLAGFAAQEGFASVHPGVEGDKPILRASRTAAQKPYAPVGEREKRAESAGSDRDPSAAGGSATRQGGPSRPDPKDVHSRDLTKKPGKWK